MLSSLKSCSKPDNPHTSRVLDTVTNSVINTPQYYVVELPNIMFPKYFPEYQNVKIDRGIKILIVKSKKNKNKSIFKRK